ncbi:hypothetical protein YC2023_121011 [Brassica napus]
MPENNQKDQTEHNGASYDLRRMRSNKESLSQDLLEKPLHNSIKWLWRFFQFIFTISPFPSTQKNLLLLPLAFSGAIESDDDNGAA